MPSSQSFRIKSFLLAATVLLASFLSGCASREERIQNIHAEATDALFENRPDEAIEILRNGLKKYADSNSIRIALSRVLQNSGETQESLALLETAVAQNPDEDQIWVKIGELRAQLGQREGAILAFESYLKNHGDDFLAWKALALENEKSGKITPAIKAALKWNNLTPSSQPALKLGELYLASNNIPQARAWLSQAAAYEDRFAAKEALALLISLETRDMQLQQASQWLKQYRARYGDPSEDPRVQDAVTIIEDWIRAREVIARAAAELQNERQTVEVTETEEAAEPWLYAVAEQPATEDSAGASAEPTPPPVEQTEEPSTTRPPEQLFGGETRMDESDAPAALADEPQPATNDVPQANPGDDRSLREQAVALMDARDYSDAIPLWWELLGQDDSNAEVWQRLSQAYFAEQEWYDAETTILEARRRSPNDETIATDYLKTIAKTQSPLRALDEIRSLRRSFPRSPGIALLHAQTLRDANAAFSAIAAAYRDFLSLADRNHPGYHEANRYLQTSN